MFALLEMISFLDLADKIWLVSAVLLVLVCGVRFLREACSWRGLLLNLLISLPALLICVCLFAFMICHKISIKLGGHTYDGKIENGLHYVRYKAKSTQVSEETWRYLEGIEWWTNTWFIAFITLVIFCLAMFLLGALMDYRNGVTVGETTGSHDLDAV